MIRKLKETTFRIWREAAPQGHGPAEYPSDHQAGMVVPQGGSMCLNCKYLGRDKKTCVNKYFIRWNGSDRLPAPADKYCSDWYEARKNG